MADLNGTVSGGQKITGTVEPQAQKLRGALRLGGGGGGVTDVWQNGESVLDGTIGKVTVPTNTSDLTNDSGFITTETDPVFGASAAKNITASNISTWNGKQDALVSGTNIKTVNNTSLLGSGNVAVQETLVSGTNIKTINGNDLLGSGNIVIQGGGGSTVSYTQTQTSGNELGTITIDGTASKIYSPTETDPTVPSWAKASSKPSYTASEVGAVPTTRKVNNKALSSDVTLNASDVGAQETLVSGTNIKTINGNSLLGSGNIVIQGGGGGGGSQNSWYGTCSTSNGTATKVVTTTTGDFVLAVGNSVKVKFADHSGGTTPITLTIDGTTAKPVRQSGAGIATYAWAYGEIVDFVYDGAYFTIVDGGIATQGTYGDTKLEDSVSSTSTSLAATPNAVKQAYDLASANAHTVTQVSITVANWNATTTCTKSVTGVTASNSIIVSPAPSSISDYVSAGVYCSAQGSGTLTFTASSTPTADLTVNVMIVG